MKLSDEFRQAVEKELGLHGKRGNNIAVNLDYLLSLLSEDVLTSWERQYESAVKQHTFDLSKIGREASYQLNERLYKADDFLKKAETRLEKISKSNEEQKKLEECMTREMMSIVNMYIALVEKSKLQNVSEDVAAKCASYIVWAFLCGDTPDIPQEININEYVPQKSSEKKLEEWKRL